ncbi:unnamed protein product, partial [Rotaria magnacalcarata]
MPAPPNNTNRSVGNAMDNNYDLPDMKYLRPTDSNPRDTIADAKIANEWAAKKLVWIPD